MAHGYARATGKAGVCMATSGPGATNLVTCIADAPAKPNTCSIGEKGCWFTSTASLFAVCTLKNVE